MLELKPAKPVLTKKTLCMYTEIELIIGMDGRVIQERQITGKSWIKDLKKKEKKVKPKVQIEMLEEEEM